MAPRRVDRFELLRLLGRGGMGEVWEGRDPALPGRRLAIKLLRADLADPGVLLRFLREAQVLARVRHPGVVAIHAAGRDPQAGPFLVTDLVEGLPLDEVVARGGLPPERAVQVVGALCRALEAVHEAGVVHRDLKPANVILGPGDAPVLLDFGLARELDRDSLTRTGEVLGTPAYMAPEQVRDPRGVDARADVYALGALLYALLRGAPPFTGSVLRVLEGVLGRGPAWPACDDPGLDAACRKAMARDPDQRYPTPAALAEALAGRTGARGRARAGRAALLLACGAAVLVALTPGGKRPAAVGPAGAVPSPALPAAPSSTGRPSVADEARRLALALQGREPTARVGAWRGARALLDGAAPSSSESLALRQLVEGQEAPLASSTWGTVPVSLSWVDDDRLLLYDGRSAAQWEPAREAEPGAPRALAVAAWWIGAGGPPLAQERGAVVVAQEEGLLRLTPGAAQLEVEQLGRPAALERPAGLAASPGAGAVVLVGGEAALLFTSQGREWGGLRLPLGPGDRPAAAAWSVDGSRLYLLVRPEASSWGDVAGFDAQGRPRLGWTFTLGLRPRCLVTGPGPEEVVVGGEGPILHCYLSPARQLSLRLPAPDAQHETLALARSGRWLLAGGDSGPTGPPGRVWLVDLGNLPRARLGEGQVLLSGADVRREWRFAAPVVSLTTAPGGGLAAVATSAGEVAVLGLPD